MKILELLVLFSCISWAHSISCMDQNNNDVDWFVGYKMPKQDDSTPPGTSQGYGYYYMDSNLPGVISPSQNDLSSSNQAVAYTLQQYYSQQNDQSLMHVMYNDEMAASFEEPYDSFLGWLKAKAKSIIGNKASEYGHTKGVVFFDQNGGYWLIHSVPKFPDSNAYSYPDNGEKFGQSMLCMTFQYSELSKIGTQLYFNHPEIYSSNLPTSMASDNPDLAKVLGGSHKTGSPTYSILDLTTVGGVTFKSFAKTGEYNDDLYDKLVAPTLQTPLDVETWRYGHAIPPDCSATYIIKNVEDIKVGSSTTFKYTKDHSKLAISSDPSSPYICIGDINRMTSQFVRGGGTACLKQAAVWTTYYQMVQQTDSPC